MLKELRSLSFVGCRNLKSIGLQQSSLQLGEDLYLPTFEADIPNRKIAEWFSYQSSGNTICFNIPPNLGDNLLGVALWVVYTCKTTESRRWSYIRAVITNKTEGVEMNHDIRVLTDKVGEVNSRIECISRDGFSYSVQLRMRRDRGEHVSMKSGDRIKIRLQRLLYFYGGFGQETQCGQVKVEMCGAHVIQKTLE